MNRDLRYYYRNHRALEYCTITSQNFQYQNISSNGKLWDYFCSILLHIITTFHGRLIEWFYTDTYQIGACDKEFAQLWHSTVTFYVALKRLEDLEVYGLSWYFFDPRCGLRQVDSFEFTCTSIYRDQRFSNLFGLRPITRSITSY